MFKVAVIEDDQPTSNQLKSWILSARPEITVDQWFTRDDAEAAIAREVPHLAVGEVELGGDRAHARQQQEAGAGRQGRDQGRGDQVQAARGRQGRKAQHEGRRRLQA